MATIEDDMDQHGTPGLSHRRVAVRELRANLTAVLRDVRAGATVLITSDEEVIAELRPPQSAAPSPRRPGWMRGKIKAAGDLNVLPDDILDAMEGRRN